MRVLVALVVMTLSLPAVAATAEERALAEEISGRLQNALTAEPFDVTTSCDAADCTITLSRR